jgi:tungstate transport system ATP-binding protein
MTVSSPLLQIRNLKVVLGGEPILDLPELDILRGEVLVVLGPNGAGKSTLLLATARLIQSASGSVTLVESPDLTDLAFRRRVATVFQAPLLLDETVYQNVGAGLLTTYHLTLTTVVKEFLWLSIFPFSSKISRASWNVSPRSSPITMSISGLFPSPAPGSSAWSRYW